MMKYFELFDDVRILHRWHLGEIVENTSGKPAQLRNGTPAPVGLPIHAEMTHVGVPLDFCLTSFAVPVATKKLAQAIAPIAGRDLQRIPDEVAGHKDFEVLNSIRIIKCLDEKLSEFTKWTEKDHRADLAGQYRMVTKLKIDPKCVPPDAQFFRIVGWSIALIVSEHIKTAMEQCGCLGAKFEYVT